jgi:hypothetical protein
MTPTRTVPRSRTALVVGTPQGLAHTSAEMVNARINCMATGTFSYPGGIAP